MYHYPQPQPHYTDPHYAYSEHFQVPQPLELHAPIPLPGQNPPLLDYMPLAQPCHQYPNQHVQFDGGRMGMGRVCEPEEPYTIPEYCAAGLNQPTFPTPSELLADLAEKGLPLPNDDDFSADSPPSESASKARRRAMAKSVGFIPTDPDTITSHDKKRYYLECMEQYVLYLHNQFELVGAQVAPLERVEKYRGLTNRSMRTMLVHMENTTRRLNLRTLAEEQRFINLRDEVLQRESAGQIHLDPKSLPYTLEAHLKDLDI